MARQVVVEILGNAKQYIAATEEANLASARLGGGLGKAGGAAKNLEKDITGISKSAAGSIPILGKFGNSIGGFPIPLLAAAAAVAGLFVAGKSIVEISEKWATAQRGLAQATAVMGVSNDKARQFVDAFIGTNKRYVQSQAEVVDSYAELTRSGLAQKEVQRDLNIALDLAAIKHISLSEATTLVNKAEHGRMKGLIDLGVVTKDQVDAQGNLIAGTKGIAAAMDALEKKTANGRETTSKLTQAQNTLSNTWQSVSNKVGPALVTALTFTLDVFLKVADAIGWVIDRVATLIGVIRDVIHWFGNLASAINNSGIGKTIGAVTGVAHTLHVPGFASGTDYVPQTMLAVVHQGEQIIPAGQRGRGANVTINLYATIADGPALDRFTNDIAQRLRWASGV